MRVVAWARWDDFTTFHDAAIASRDIDPVYPVLEHVAATSGWETEALVRAVLLHVAYYDLGSALHAAHLHLDQGVPLAQVPNDLPCATERRNHRQPHKLTAHLAALEADIRIHGSAVAWLREPLRGTSPTDDFEHLAGHIARVYGNGRWAAYKTAEMLWKCAGWPVKAATLAMDQASGPRHGLAIIAPGMALNEATAQRLCIDLSRAGHPAAPEEVETTLCDFHALCRGAYYTGHDIDQMQAQLARAPQSPHVTAAWMARKATIPHAYLGELGGWPGVDRERKRLYRETGQIVLRGADG